MAKATDEQDIFQLLEEVERRKQPAIEALLQQRKEIDDKLSRLGHNHVPVTTTGPKRGRPAGSTNVKPNLPPKPEGAGPKDGEWKWCSQCNQWGDHDARKHRIENIKKKQAAQ